MKKDFLKSTYGFIERIVTFYSFFEIILRLTSNGKLSTIDLLSEINSAFRYILLLIIVVVLIGFLNRLSKEFEVKTLDFQSEKIIKNRNKKRPKVIDLKEFIPSNDEMDKLLETTRRKALLWSGDAILLRFTFFLDVSENIKITIVATYFSESKKEELTIYLPWFGATIREVPKLELTPNKKPFFKKYKSWGKATVEAYKILESELSEKEFTMHIGVLLFNEQMSINFHFLRGIKQITRRFEYNGKKINKRLINL